MAEKPKKPYLDFPLFPHASGQWAKKIRGKLRYFGVWADPDAALAEYVRQRDDLQAGRTPGPGVGIPIVELVNRFLTHKRIRVDSGELSERSWSEYDKSCQRILRVLGRTRELETIRPGDFDALRADIAKTRKAVALGTEIQRCRSVFGFAYTAGLIPAPINFGKHFSRPAKRVMRLARNSRAKQLLEPHEIRDLIDVGKPVFRAMVLLGINAGFGQGDIASLPCAAVDLDGGWIRFARPKTGIQRDCPLWPETVDALQEAVRRRGPPTHASDDLFFISQQGYPFVRFKAGRGGRIDAVAQCFRRAAMTLGIKRAKVGFYALRHTFRTVADAVKDPPAIKRIMGHSEEDPTDEMRAIYVEQIDDARLVAVSEHVRRWLYLGPSR